MALHRKPSQPLQQALEYLQRKAAALENSGIRQFPNVRVLSAEAGVAPRTIRKALQALAAEGVVTVVNRGGVVLRSAPPIPAAHRSAGEMAAEATQSTKAARVHERISDDIRNGGFAPGTPLPSLKELCQRYACSYGTLRAALETLAQSGMLVRRHRGFAVFATTARGSRATIAIVKQHTDFRSARQERQIAMWRDFEKACVRHGVQFEAHGLYDVETTRAARLASLADFVRKQEREGCLGYIAWLPTMSPDALENVYTYLLPTGKPICYLEETGGPLIERLRSFGRISPRFAWLPYSYTPKAGLEVAKHLISLGHHRVAWFALNPNDEWSVNRLQGLRKGFSAVGLHDAVTVFQADTPDRPAHESSDSHAQPQPEIEEFFAAMHTQYGRFNLARIRTDMLHELSARHQLHTWLRPLFEEALDQDDITAWVGAHDPIAVAALEFLKKRGIPVPQKLSVVGFDDSLDAVLRGLTSYSIDEERIANAVMSHILSPPIRRSHRTGLIDVPGVVMARRTSGPPRKVPQ